MLVEMKFKKYTEKEFEKFCEEQWIDSDFGEEIWKFIEDREVHLSTVNSIKGSKDEGILTIKIKCFAE